MIIIKLMTLSCFSIFLLSGCSPDLEAEFDTSPINIYQSACPDCHQPDKNDIIYKFVVNKPHSAYITHKFNNTIYMVPISPQFKVEGYRIINAIYLDLSKTE